MTTTYTDPIGTVEEADIELNAGHFSWFDAADSAKPHTPIEEVLIHELGHALGFKDLCLSDAREPLKVCTEEEEASVMRPGSGSTTLTDYDVRLLCATYPRTRDYPVRGGTNPTTWLLALPVAVLALFHCLFRRR